MGFQSMMFFRNNDSKVNHEAASVEERDEDELKSFALVGALWRPQKDVEIEVNEEDRPPVTLTHKNVGIIVDDDFETGCVTIAFVDANGKLLTILDGCVEKFLIAEFEPVDVESCRALRTAMSFYWDDERFKTKFFGEESLMFDDDDE